MRKMTIAALVLLPLLSCKAAKSPAEAHLRVLGYKEVACDDGQYDVACRADGRTFRCIVLDAEGCDGGPHVVCEPSGGAP